MNNPMLMGIVNRQAHRSKELHNLAPRPYAASPCCVLYVVSQCLSLDILHDEADHRGDGAFGIPGRDYREVVDTSNMWMLQGSHLLSLLAKSQHRIRSSLETGVEDLDDDRASRLWIVAHPRFTHLA